MSRLRFAIQGFPIPAVSSAGDVDACVMALPRVVPDSLVHGADLNRPDVCCVGRFGTGL